MVDVSRTSSYNTHQTTLSDAMVAQTELSRLQTQISSGRKAEYFDEMDGQVEVYAALTNRLSRTELFVRNNLLTSNRLQSMSNVLEQVIDIASDTKNLLVLARSSTAEDSLAFEERLDGLWGAFTGQMNTNADGRYLFSGTRTDVAPIDTDFPVLETSGEADDGYYLGAKENIQLRVQDDYEFEQTLRADDPGFQDVVAAFAMARVAHREGDDAKMAQAFDLIQSGISGVISAKAVVDTHAINVDNATERLKNLQVYWKGVQEDMVNTDLVSASTQVAINQSILQASFQVFARINQLKLSDYLR